MFILSHLNQKCTFEKPVKGNCLIKSKQRSVYIEKDRTFGYGFVAGSENPVIVRFITEDGPSFGILEPGDEILSINGKDVKQAPREDVIEIIRSLESIQMVVSQPAPDMTSTLLSKKANMRSKSNKVRFAQSISVEVFIIRMVV